MRKFVMLPGVLIILLTLTVPSQAVTVDEVAAMAKANVSDDVILTLLKATDSTFKLTPDDIVLLKDAGVSDAVIIAMIGDKGEATDEEAGKDIYLQLTDEQFKRLYLGQQDIIEETVVQEPKPVRQPQYYRSTPVNYGQGYVSRPNYNTPSYSSGISRTTYYNVYPDGYKYGRKFYRPVYYYTWPGYYIYDGTVYYPGHYRNYPPSISPYPLSYEFHHPSYYYSRHSHPRSYGKFGYYKDDDWYFSLGFRF